MIDRYCKLDANVDRSTSCMERVCDTHTSICMERDQMSPQPRPRHLMIGRWSSSACMSLIGTYLCSARATSTLSSPILGKAATQHWRHIHMLRLTPTRVAYRLQATMHASHRITHYSRVSPLADVATLLPTRNMSPMQIYYDLPREVV
jgi:hypothetical protein